MKKSSVTYGSVVLSATVSLCAALATAVVTVKILRVETPEGKMGHFHVFYTAKVLELTRSASGIENGQTLRIASYHVTEKARKAGFVGARIPPLLRKGWEGKVYLNKKQDKTGYDIAAYGESFEEAPKAMP
jgi:hypothetical protein